MIASIVMPSFNRYELAQRSLASIFNQKTDAEVIFIDDGSTDNTPWLEEEFPIRYIRLNRTKPDGWGSPCLPCNIGIRSALSDIIILNGSDVCHTSNNITRMAERLAAEPRSVIYSACHSQNLDWDGSNMGDILFDSRVGPIAAWYSVGVRREHLMEMRGFDEDYIYPGYEDNDLQERMVVGLGLKHIIADDIVAIHQEHPPAAFYTNKALAAKAEQLYRKKSMEWRAGQISHVRNIGREWGVLP